MPASTRTYARKASPDPVTRIKFSSVASVTQGLEKLALSPRTSFALAGSRLNAHPRKGRMLVQGSVAMAADLRDVHGLVLEAKQKRNPTLRRELVRAYKQAGRHVDMLTALSTLPGKEAAPFLRDYFELGGSTKEVVEWLVQIAPLRDGGPQAASSRRRGSSRRGRGLLNRIGEFFQDVGQAVVDAVRNVVDAVLQAGQKIADIMSDLLALAAGDLKEAVATLLAAGVALKEFVVSALEKGHAATKKIWTAFLAVGRTVREILQAAYDFARIRITTALQAFLALGRTLAQILEAAYQAGHDFFVAIGRALAQIGQDALDFVKWAVTRAGDVFDWAMEVYERVRQTFVDVIMWAAGVKGVVMKKVVDWLDDHLGETFDAFKDRIVIPVLAVGKLGLVALILLASCSKAFRAVVMFVIKRVLIRENQTDYHLWPATLASFRAQFRAQQKLLDLPAVDVAHKYVLVSDLHMDAQDDVDAGIGHFFHNEQLLVSVLGRYASDPAYTLIVLGDEQDFWYCADLDQFESPAKLDDITETHPAIFATLKQFHQAGRLVKMRGNHDSLYRDTAAVTRYRSHGFPNLRVYDYALVKFQARDLLLMHGQQFDPFNCDANETFGKFVSNFISEPIDALDAVVKRRFGKRFPDASLEGRVIAPYFTPEQWPKEMANKNADAPAIADGATFKETPIIEQVRKFGTSMILGHTHGPKILKVAGNKGGTGTFYANIGTCGWWENAVWTLEIQPDDLVLTLWTVGTAGGLPEARNYKLSEATVSV